MDVRSAFNISYIAGIFDVIGSLKIEIPDDDPARAFILAWITHTDFQLMELLQSFGAVVSKTDKCFKAKWRDHKVLGFFKRIRPYVKLKKEYIDLGIEFMEQKLRGADPQAYVKPLKCRLKLLKKS